MHIIFLEQFYPPPPVIPQFSTLGQSDTKNEFRNFNNLLFDRHKYYTSQHPPIRATISRLIVKFVLKTISETSFKPPK